MRDIVAESAELADRDQNDPMAVEFGVLGAVEVRVGGRVLPVGGSKPLIVLAGLLLRANRVVSVDELAWWLWDGDDSRGSKGALQTYVLRVRRALGEHATIRTERNGYLLEVDPEALDLGRFRARAEQGGRAAECGDLRSAVAAFGQALGQWRGPALSNVDSDALRRDEVGVLEDARLSAVEQWADALLGLGDNATVVPRLMAVTKENPLRERPHEQLMIALHRMGRQADALAVYREISTALAEELGLDPGPPLRQAHQLILSGEPDTPAVGVPFQRRGSAGPMVPRQLPGDFAGFTGRREALDGLRGVLGTGRTPLASVEGMGGVGKTTLAVHFAHEVAGRYPGGQLYLDLRGYGPGEPLSSAAALDMMLTAVGVPSRLVPADLAERAALWRTHTSGRKLLILLDNAGTTEQVRPLLPGADCLVLVTSRARLRSLAAVHGARRIPVEELPVSDAVELLAGIVGRDAVEAEPEAARAFVARCGRLPLAIRILAVRASQFPSVSLAEFVESFDSEQDKLSSFDLNDGDETDLRAVFSRSYTALTPEAARLLRLLGATLEHNFGVPAAAALAGLGMPKARALLDSLASAHLITEIRPGRYQFHDLIREFAADLCRHTDDEATRTGSVDRFLAWTMATVMKGALLLRPGRRYELIDLPATPAPMVFTDRKAALRWFDDEADNLLATVRLAHAGARHAVAWQLAWLLQSFYVVRTRLHDWRTAFELALQSAAAIGDRRGEAGILNGLGVMHGVARNEPEAIRFLVRVLEIQRELGDQEGEARAQYNLSMACMNTDKIRRSLEHGAEAVRLARALGIRTLEADSVQAMADAHSLAGEYDQALELVEQALVLWEDEGQSYQQPFLLHSRGRALLGVGRREEGLACVSHSAELFLVRGELYEAGDVLAQLAAIYLRLGDREQARAHFLRSIHVLTESGHPYAEDVRAKLAGLVGTDMPAR